MGNNKFQWSRVDEILMFVIALGFLILMAYMGMPSEAIMAMAGSLMTIVPIYIKSALERKNDSEDEIENGDSTLTVLPVAVEKTLEPPLANPPIHHLRDEG